MQTAEATRHPEEKAQCREGEPAWEPVLPLLGMNRFRAGHKALLHRLSGLPLHQRRSKSSSQRASSDWSSSRARRCAASDVDVRPVVGELALELGDRLLRAPAISASSRSSSLGCRGWLRRRCGLLPSRGSRLGRGSGGASRSSRAADVVGPAAVVGARACRPRSRASASATASSSARSCETSRTVPGERLERGLERLAALEVEVVRRLVEHEEVRARGDDEREREPAALAARERRDRLLVRLPAREEEAAEQVLRLRAAAGRSRAAAQSSTVPRSSSSTSCCEK